jgi:hypothetical protein
MRKCGRIWSSRRGDRWQYNRAHAHCLLDNKGYRHTLRICNTYCFPWQQCLREGSRTRTRPVVFDTLKQSGHCRQRTYHRWWSGLVLLLCIIQWMCVFVYLYFVYDLCSGVFSVERCWVFVDGWTVKDVKGIGLSSLEVVVQPDRLPGGTAFVKNVFEFCAEIRGGSYVTCQSKVQYCQLRRRLERRETLNIRLSHLSWRIILN